jgi:hypothetical protein
LVVLVVVVAIARWTGSRGWHRVRMEMRVSGLREQQRQSPHAMTVVKRFGI